MMKKVCMMLKAQLWCMTALSLAVVILYENGVLLPGDLSGQGDIEFVSATAMELITICMLPLSLRLFKFRRIKELLQTGREQALRFWGTVRLQMICIPMLVNTLLYYMTGMNVAFGYMAIILLVGLVFVYPGEARCMADISDDKQEA